VTLSDFLSLNIYVNVPSKSNKQKKLSKKLFFLLASRRSMTKIAGSGSRNRVKDPDPLVRGMYPRIRIHTKMSWIRNTGDNFQNTVLYEYMSECGFGSSSQFVRTENIKYHREKSKFFVTFSQKIAAFSAVQNCF
jgi:hypothetical protein